MNFDASFEALVRNGFAAALAAGQPDRITRSAYAALDQQPTAVIALGKAAGAMAAAVRNGGYMVRVLSLLPMKTTARLMVLIVLQVRTRFLMNAVLPRQLRLRVVSNLLARRIICCC